MSDNETEKERLEPNEIAETDILQIELLEELQDETTVNKNIIEPNEVAETDFFFLIEPKRSQHENDDNAAVVSAGLLELAHRKCQTGDYEGSFVVTDVKKQDAYVENGPHTRRVVHGTFNIVFLQRYIKPTSNRKSAAEAVNDSRKTAPTD